MFQLGIANRQAVQERQPVSVVWLAQAGFDLCHVEGRVEVGAQIAAVVAEQMPERLGKGDASERGNSGGVGGIGASNRGGHGGTPARFVRVLPRMRRAPSAACVGSAGRAGGSM